MTNFELKFDQKFNSHFYQLINQVRHTVSSWADTLIHKERKSVSTIPYPIYSKNLLKEKNVFKPLNFKTIDLEKLTHDTNQQLFNATVDKEVSEKLKNNQPMFDKKNMEPNEPVFGITNENPLHPNEVQAISKEQQE